MGSNTQGSTGKLTVLNQSRFNGGIAASEKEGIAGAGSFITSLNIHQDPAKVGLHLAPTKVSGSTVLGMVKWIVSGMPHNSSRYFYDANGYIYEETSGGSWNILRGPGGTYGAGLGNSHGQGMVVFNNYLYYTTDTQIGRFGPLDGSTPQGFQDNWQTGLNSTAASGYAPMYQFADGFVVGHANQVAYWDGSVFTLARLTFPTGVYCRSISQLNEYVVIGTWRSATNSITDTEEGYLFFWDGAALTFNYVVDVSEGATNALQNSKNRLFGIFGSQGAIYQDVLSYVNQFDKLQQLPKLALTNYVEVYPGAMVNWRGKTYFGVSATDSTDVTVGVYEWGTLSAIYPEVLNCPFTISTGNTGILVQITALGGFGRSFYIAWVDSTSGTAIYGVDKVQIGTGSFAHSGSYEFFIFDDKRPYSDKQALVIKANHTNLNVGETVKLGYKTNRAAAYTYGDVHSYSAQDALPGQTRLNIPASDGRFTEFQYIAVITSPGSTTPYITSVGMSYDPLFEEDY